MHISGHYREGIVFNTITYNDNGVVRPVFYRLSLAEMVVPYAAPEWPHPRKFAFDVGEYVRAKTERCHGFLAHFAFRRRAWEFSPIRWL